MRLGALPSMCFSVYSMKYYEDTLNSIYLKGQERLVARENFSLWERLVLRLQGWQEGGKWKGEPNTPYALKSKAEEKP